MDKDLIKIAIPLLNESEEVSTAFERYLTSLQNDLVKAGYETATAVDEAELALRTAIEAYDEAQDEIVETEDETETDWIDEDVIQH